MMRAELLRVLEAADRLAHELNWANHSAVLDAYWKAREATGKLCSVCEPPTINRIITVEVDDATQACVAVRITDGGQRTLRTLWERK